MSATPDPSSAPTADPVGALRRSHEHLTALVTPLSTADLGRPSFCDEWPISQVLSHLGSQAEILGTFLTAARAGEPEPGFDTFPPVWDRWNALSPEEHRAAYVESSDRAGAAIEEAHADRPDLEVPMFGGQLRVTPAGFAQVRLFEHAVHTWDVAVALDPGATIAPEPAALIVDQLPDLLPRFATEEAPTVALRVVVRDPDRAWVLTSSAEASIVDWADQPVDATVALTGEQLIRLVAHRLTPADDLAVEGSLTRPEVEAAFPAR